MHLKAIHSANISPANILPLDLLNKLYTQKINQLFPNVCIALRIFCCLPVSVASGERSFSKLKMVKNYQRSTMGQDRLSALAILSIASKIARSIDLKKVLATFAEKKARKAPI